VALRRRRFGLTLGERRLDEGGVAFGRVRRHQLRRGFGGGERVVPLAHQQQHPAQPRVDLGGLIGLDRRAPERGEGGGILERVVRADAVSEGFRGVEVLKARGGGAPVVRPARPVGLEMRLNRLGDDRHHLPKRGVFGK
jgi:hypothetical protein